MIGAGTGNANGFYRQDGKYNGKPQFKKIGDETVKSTYCIILLDVVYTPPAVLELYALCLCCVLCVLVIWAEGAYTATLRHMHSTHYFHECPLLRPCVCSCGYPCIYRMLLRTTVCDMDIPINPALKRLPALWRAVYCTYNTLVCGFVGQI